jgi:hypothetical protein
MDFDPGMFQDDDYDGDFDDGSGLDDSPEVEYDDLGNPIFLAAAAGFGAHMMEDEIDEREIAKDILSRKDEDPEPEKIPLRSRHPASPIKAGPFERWVIDVQAGRKKITDPIEYTKEEAKQIMDAEKVEE